MSMSVVAFPLVFWNTKTNFSLGSPFNGSLNFCFPLIEKDLTVLPEKLITSTLSTGSEAKMARVFPFFLVSMVRLDVPVWA